MLATRGVIRDSHEAAVNCVAHSPHRREFYSASADNSVKCWDTETGKLIRVLSQHKGWVTDLLYIVPMRQLISCSIDGQMLCWMLKASSAQSKTEKVEAYDLLAPEQKGKGPKGGGAAAKQLAAAPIHCMAYCERRKLVITSTGGKINIYNVSQYMDKAAGVRKTRLVLESSHGSGGVVKMHDDIIRCLLIVDDRTVLTAGYARCVGVYDLETRKKLRSIATPSDHGHEGAIAAMTFDTHNNRIITGGYDRTVKVWSMPPDGRLLQNFDTFAESLTGVCYCEVTKTLWASCSSGRPQVYDLHSGTNITQIVHTGVDGLRSPSMQKLWYFHSTKEIVATTAARDIVYWRYNPTAALRVLHGHKNWVEVLAVTSPPGPAIPELFSAGMDKIVKKWELGTKFNPDAIYCNDEYTGHAATILCGCFSDEHSLLATGSEDGVIRVWEYATDQKRLDLDTVEKFELLGHAERVTGLCVAAVRELAVLISVSWDQSIRFWDLREGIEYERPGDGLAVIEDAHDDYIYDVAFCGAGAQGREVFATGSADRTVKLWDFALCEAGKGLGACTAVLRGHEGEVFRVCWDAFHAQWLSGSDDATVCCWELDGGEDGAPTHVVPTREPVTALCVDTSSGHCVVGTLELTLRVYDLHAGECVSTHHGHTDSIRSIVHIPSMNEYISCSWDQTIRIWKAQPPPKTPGLPGAALGGGADAAATVPVDATTPGKSGAGAAAQPAPVEPEDEQDIPYEKKFPQIVPKTVKEMLSNRGAFASDGGAGGGAASTRSTRRAAVAAAKHTAEPAPAPRRVTRVEHRLDQLEADLRQADHLIPDDDVG